MMSTRIIAFLSLVLASCGGSTIYEERHDLEGFWAKEDILKYELNVHVKDTVSLYDVQLDIEHTQDYPFENIYLRLQSQVPNRPIQVDTISVSLMDKSGNWKGKCSGENCHQIVTLTNDYRFTEKGSHSISIEQFTREDTLIGMKSIALSVKRQGA